MLSFAENQHGSCWPISRGHPSVHHGSFENQALTQSKLAMGHDDERQGSAGLPSHYLLLIWGKYWRNNQLSKWKKVAKLYWLIRIRTSEHPEKELLLCALLITGDAEAQIGPLGFHLG